MSRIAIPARESVPQESKPLLDAVERQLGVVPNMFRVFALSPSALAGYTGFSAALGKALDLKTRERIALAVAQANACDYCLSAHTYLALNLAKIPAEDAAQARHGRSPDVRADAALRFAMAVLDTRGQISDGELAAVRAAGYSEAQVVEIIALVAENLLTNLLNKAVQTDIDFPLVTA